MESEAIEMEICIPTLILDNPTSLGCTGKLCEEGVDYGAGHFAFVCIIKTNHVMFAA